MVLWSVGNKHMLAAHWSGGSWIVHLPWWSLFWRRPCDRSVFSEKHRDIVIGRRGQGYRLRIKRRWS